MTFRGLKQKWRNCSTHLEPAQPCLRVGLGSLGPERRMRLRRGVIAVCLVESPKLPRIRLALSADRAAPESVKDRTRQRCYKLISTGTNTDPRFFEDAMEQGAKYLEA